MPTLKQGDRGPEVNLLQQRLTQSGFSIDADGQFGPATHAAVVALQQKTGLVVDGIAGPKVMAALLNHDTDKLLTQADITAAADALGVDIAAVFAVKAVESRGHGFFDDGSVVILYERHVMKKRLASNDYRKDEITQLATTYPRLINSKPGGYKGGSAEHFRLSMARDIDHASALESCSWGLFQIMGYHWPRLGFSSIDAFVTAMQASEGNQLAAFVQFIKADSKLHQALMDKDWPEFARRYNGPGYKKNSYDTKLASAYENYLQEAA